MSISALGSQSLSQLYTSVFKKLDADESGSVSSDELTTALSSKSGTTEMAASTATKLFSAMDSDSDGSLTATELSSYFQSNLSLSTLTGVQSETGAAKGPPPGGRPAGGPPPGGGGQPPSMSDIDSDGDGSISKTEMQSFGTTVMGDSDTTKADEVFSAMDADQDGTVTAAEKSAFDEQMATRMASGGPETPSDEAATSITTASAQTDLVAQLTSRWLQSLYASLSDTADYSAKSAGSTVSVSA